MCGYFCIEFIDFMLNVKSLLEYTNLFPPKEYTKNDKMKLKCFQQDLNKLMEIYRSGCNKYRKFKKSKILYNQKINKRSFYCLL